MQMKTSYLISRFIPYYKKYWKTLTIDLCFAALTTLCDMALPMIVRYITDAARQGSSFLSIQDILFVGVLYIFLRIVDAVAAYYMANIGHVMGAKIETDMRRDLFHHLQQLSFSYYNNTQVGQIMARITSDLFDVTEFAHHVPEEFFIAGLKITIAFVILIQINVPLTLMIFAIIPFMLFFSTRYNRKMRRAFKMSRTQIGEINAQVEDSLLGIRVVKSFANEEMECMKFEESNSEFLGIKKISYRYMGGFITMIRFFDSAMYITVLMGGSFLLLKGQISPGDFIAYLLFVTTLLTSIRRVVEFTEQFQRGLTGIERFIEILDEPFEIIDVSGAKVLSDVQGQIDFDNVSFQYSDGDSEVLSNIDLHVEPGENIAIIGPSGGGKTTLCNLIPRFYDVTGGSIKIDGQDIRDVTLKSLRSNIGMVQQDVYLFSGTLMENIAYGKPGATEEEIIEAAKLAGAHDFIMALNEGYHSYVGERGLKLSGGQRQRISIARVFLKNPPILILDEATSALDNESERLVQQSLKQLTKGRTTFTIAHRLTTIRHADIILVLTKEGIVERGTHENLLSEEGVYHHMLTMYEDNEAEEEAIDEK